jgi:hypothetical protein
MNTNELKDIFSKEDLERIIFTIAGIVLLIIFFLTSQAILPENCYLYEWRQVGFLCDGISEIPQPCPDCKNETMTSVAQIAFGFGIACFFLPVIVPLIKKLQNHPVKQPKLFD